MKVHSSRRSVRQFTCFACLAVILGWTTLGLGAPPPAKEDPNVFRRVGSFLFKKSRQLEKSEEPPKPLLPPGTSRQPAGADTSNRRAAPTLPPMPSSPTTKKRGETKYLRDKSDAASTKEPQGDAAAKSKTEKGTAAAPEMTGPPAPLNYATPVAGRPGFVYPPGAERIEANMLDVRGLNPGQKARDPRTSSMFLVP